MSWFFFEGRRVWYEESGAGTPLLLLHGNAASSNMFFELAERYRRQFRVVLLDFLGNGRSQRLSRWPADLWFDEAQQAIALLRERGYEKVDLIGCSGGALAAVNVALEAPALVGRVIADSFEGERPLPAFTESVREQRARSKREEAARQFYFYMHGADWEQVVDRDTDAILRHSRQIGAFFHRPLCGLEAELLLTGSREDEFTAALSPDYLQRAYGALLQKVGHGRMHLFDHGAHPAMLSNPEAFYQLSMEFLQG